jgi:sterol desaturase/sphingolipid hydroxylase (fatty acid hydroxylase superfamily)
MNKERLSLLLMQLRTCRYEPPAIRKPIKRLRYVSLALTMTLFAVMLSLVLMVYLQAMQAAAANGGDPDAAGMYVLVTYLPYVVAILIGAFVLAEVVYSLYRRYLLGRLRS